MVGISASSLSVSLRTSTMCGSNFPSDSGFRRLRGGNATLHDSLPSRRDFAPCLDRAGRFVEDPFSQLIEAGPEPRLGAITVGLPADFASPDKDRGGLAGPGDSERHQRKKGVELGGDDEARVLEVEPAGLGVAEEALDGPAFLVRV